MQALTRAELLQENIRQQSAELAELQTATAMNQRLRSAADGLRNFRDAVAAQRKQITRFDEQIDEALAALKTSCETAHIIAHGFLTLSPDGKRMIDSATNTLQQLVLARFRSQHQLKESEVRLQEMENDNASLSEAHRV